MVREKRTGAWSMPFVKPTCMQKGTRSVRPLNDFTCAPMLRIVADRERSRSSS